MIPIFSDPKRFVAALGSTQARKMKKAALAVGIRSFPQQTCMQMRQPFQVQKQTQLYTSVRMIETTIRDKNKQFSSTSTSNVRIQNDKNEILTIAPHPHHTKQVIKPTVSAHLSPALQLENGRCENWWTGKPPLFGVCPGVSEKGQIHSIPQLNTHECTKKALKDYFDNTWTLTEVLLSSLQGEPAFQAPPLHGLRHPLIFYYGHPAALYINKLRVAGLLKAPVNEYFEVIFETGVDEMSWDDLSNNNMPWPSVSAVHAYRKKVFTVVSELIESLSNKDCANITIDSPLWALIMSFEHERIHLETSSVLINEMPSNLVRFPAGFAPYNPAINKSINTTNNSNTNIIRNPEMNKDYPMNEFIPLPAQTITIGKDRNYPSFGWDNEYGQRSFELPAFQASKYKVTNGEYLEFVRDGGYSNKDFWTEAGWSWRTFRNTKWPTFWVRDGPQGLHHFNLRLIFDVVPMPWSCPVAVNFHEASAYAKWKTMKSSSSGSSNDSIKEDKNVIYRVMSELEHHAIRGDLEKIKLNGKIIDKDPVLFSATNELNQNTGLCFSSPSPVDFYPPNKNGFYDASGNMWEWCSDYFCALPGFQVHPYYEDFSTPCFDGLHNVIVGSSFISTGNEASAYSRFHFRPHFLQHASFRLTLQQKEGEKERDEREREGLISSINTQHDTFLTSDTDAPGPYVGLTYPFRRSKEGVKKAVAAEKQYNLSLEMAKFFQCNTESYLQHLQNTNRSTSSTTSVITTEKKIFTDIQSLILHYLDSNVIDSNNSNNNNELLTRKDCNIIEVGCGAGQLVFSLSQHVRSVMGIDHNNDYIEVAKRIQQGAIEKYSIHGGGNDNNEYSVSLKDFQHNQQQHHSSSGSSVVANTNQRISFRCADPMCLPAELYNFDVVYLNDIIDKVSSPNSVLGRVSGARALVKKGGLLVLSSCYQWEESKTPKELWLGGYLKDHQGKEAADKIVCSVETIKKRFSGEFTLVHRQEMPLIWPVTAKDLRVRLLDVTVWKRC